MNAFDDASRRHIQLRKLGIKHGLFIFHVAAAWFPADGRVAGSEHERGDRIAASRSALHGDGLGRKYIHIQIRQRQGGPVDDTARHRQVEAAIVIELGNLQLILHFHVEGAAGLRDQLLRAAGAGWGRFQLERLGIIDARQHRRRKEQWQSFAAVRLPVNFCRAGGNSVRHAELL